VKHMYKIYRENSTTTFWRWQPANTMLQQQYTRWIKQRLSTNCGIFFCLQSYCSPSPENNFPWDFTASNLDWSMCIWPNAMHLYIRLRK
jgi:hypothetical protein